MKRERKRDWDGERERRERDKRERRERREREKFTWAATERVGEGERKKRSERREIREGSPLSRVAG